MRRWWLRFQDGRWWWRVPAKLLLVGVTLFAVCFPRPGLFFRQIQHWSDPNALIEPDAAMLSPLVEELRGELKGIESGPKALKVVERFVYKKVPYAWDWDTWGVADYMPTVEEVLTAGREDCDGRAVVSASLLRNLGYEAELVSDLTHVWVKTDRGETMSPGKMPKFVSSSPEGRKINWRALTNIPRSAAYGISVFPLMRELIVLAVVWLVGFRPGVGWKAAMLSSQLMLGGLLLLRWSSADPWRDFELGVCVQQWFAFANLVVGWGTLRGANRRARRRAIVGSS